MLSNAVISCCLQKKRQVQSEALAGVPGVSDIDLTVPLHIPGIGMYTQLYHSLARKL